jgi:hypothetical protein
MDTLALIGKVITRSHAIEKLLRKHYPTAKGGLFAALNILGDTLPAILVRSIKTIAVVRNDAAHPDRFKPGSVPPDFDRLCDEIELLIPYFAGQPHAKPAQPSKEPKPSAPTKPSPAKPKATAATPEPQSNDVAPKVPANHGKPWTDEEDKRLEAGFKAKLTFPELAKAHQRGIGGIQSRLIKLGMLTADQYKTYPPESL